MAHLFISSVLTMFQLPLKINLDSSATLASFFVGLNVELIENIKTYLDYDLHRQDNTNMLFIWGAESSGKSHLAQAICRLFDQSCEKTCVYLPLNNTQISYHILDGLAEVDLVCIDNLESIKGDQNWQVALFNLYNELKDLGKKLIIFSNETPLQMQMELADLSSRLSSIPLYKLQKIDEKKLIEFVQSSGINVGMGISIDVATFILNRSDRSIINLKKIIHTLDEQSLTHQRKITIPFVKEILHI